jgi:hypothetical protein
VRLSRAPVVSIASIRGRALEVLLGADDISGDLAEQYGYVNRALPDGQLDEFVEALATRIASFDKRAISETKRFVDVASLPPDYELAPEWDALLRSCGRLHKKESRNCWSWDFTSRVTWKTVWAITSGNLVVNHIPPEGIQATPNFASRQSGCSAEKCHAIVTLTTTA